MEIDFDVKTNNAIGNLSVRATAGLKREIRDMMDEASRLALQHMMQHVPRGRLTYSGQGNKKTIFSSLGRSDLIYRPGGAGGGGTYHVIIGTLDNPPDHLQFVTEGTKDYPPRGNLGRTMAIQKLGEPVRFRTSRKGQDPQTDWYEQAFANTRAFIAARLQTMDILQ